MNQRQIKFGRNKFIRLDPTSYPGWTRSHHQHARTHLQLQLKTEICSSKPKTDRCGRRSSVNRGEGWQARASADWQREQAKGRLREESKADDKKQTKGRLYV
ncbi:hypothetical protein Droror1_Dr00014545 [Drosera rotundifolia]